MYHSILFVWQAAAGAQVHRARGLADAAPHVHARRHGGHDRAQADQPGQPLAGEGYVSFTKNNSIP
jgi:hypothetical protein